MANARFTTSFRRLMPSLSYQHTLIASLLCAVILYSLVVAGCTSSSSSIPSLYLVSLSYQQGTPIKSSSQVNPNLTATFNNLVNGTSLEVRTGYFGLCVTHAGGIWMCSSDSVGLAR
ncbi:hypothetical protein ABVK25_006344 [Lepraria finkii]|uniref:Uncharacterized protein n=1 Tax=Lepraria finkii TaxID=1340010 RepID=A0ABR4B6F9_9LECA